MPTAEGDEKTRVIDGLASLCSQAHISETAVGTIYNYLRD